nr:hypothetical protein [Desulfobulbaceae bacterium]
MGLRRKLLLLVIFICIAIAGIIIASNLFVNKVKIGGVAYNGIELKNYVVDIVARSRVNWNMLNSSMKTQIFDEYDEDNSVPDIAETISEAINEMDAILRATLTGSELDCASCHALDYSEEINKSLVMVKSDWAAMNAMLLTKILPALADDDKETALDLFTGEYDDLYITVMASSKEIVDGVRTSLESMKENTKREVRRFSLYFIAAGAGVLIIILLVAGLTVEKVVKKIKEAVSEIESSCANITAESGVTSKTSERNADIATEMAAAIEESSASLEEISSMVKQTDENASNTERKMKENMLTIEQANSDVVGLKENMMTIKNDTDKISKIMTEIDAIAFQTNLLALNAAVEAARAGEAGAGFAVVAEEVRNLALRTTESSTSTQSLIEVAIRNVNAGLSAVDKVDVAMADISQSTKANTALIVEISTAMHQQTEGIGQINRATSEMESRTQGLAAGSEELAAASMAILGQTNVLYQTIADLVEVIGGSKGLNDIKARKQEDSTGDYGQDVPKLPES